MFKSKVLLLFLSVGLFLEQGYSEHLRITSILDMPYLYKSDLKYGEDEHFKGFSVDLAEKLSDLLNSTYTITLVKDGFYGMQIANSSNWNGMIGEIIRGEADLAIAALTITSNRAKVVDISTRFLETRLAILANKGRVPIGPLSLHSACNLFVPMTVQLWLALISAAILTCLILTVIEKRLKDVHDEEGAGDLFTFTPRSLAGRTIKLVFVIFIGFFLAAYTANLSVFRSVNLDEFSPASQNFESVEDLSHQTEVKYGVITGGSTYNFFRTSSNPRYKSMFNFMEKHDTSVKSNWEGVQRVMDSQGRFAFIMESPKAKYATKDTCNVRVVDIFGPSKGYGVVTRKNSKLSQQVNLAILELQETGFLEELEHKWWNADSHCNPSTQYRNTNTGRDGPVMIHLRSLTIENMAVIFIFLIIGLIVSAVIAVCEIRAFKKNYI